jgi:dihydrofolate reductase
MRKLILIVQTSLDGYVADPNGKFDNFIGGEENLGFVCSITEGADAALFGRVTYQMLNNYWPTAGDKPDATSNIVRYSNWYKSVSKYVLSKTFKIGDAENAYIIPDNIEAEIKSIKNKPGKTILIFGSPRAGQSLFELNLIDELWIIVHPVIFGQGISFLGDRNSVTKLELIVCRQLSNGTLCNHYSIKK